MHTVLLSSCLNIPGCFSLAIQQSYESHLFLTIWKRNKLDRCLFLETYCTDSDNTVSRKIYLFAFNELTFSDHIGICLPHSWNVVMIHMLVFGKVTWLLYGRVFASNHLIKVRANKRRHLISKITKAYMIWKCTGNGLVSNPFIMWIL